MCCIPIFPFETLTACWANFQAFFFMIPHFFHDVELQRTPSSWANNWLTAPRVDEQHMTLQVASTPARRL